MPDNTDDSYDDYWPVYRGVELFKMVEKLNALMPDYEPWKQTQAAKDHEDLFGDRVQRGQIYFKRSIGVGWGDVIKLSQRSMDRLLLALFGANPHLEGLADHRLEERRKELKEMYDRYSPFSDLFKTISKDEENP